MIWKQKTDIAALRAFSKNTLDETLGIEITEIGPDFLIARMPVDHRHVQPFRILHGGANVVLAETLGSVASQLCLEDLSKMTAVGVEINANHLRSVAEGGEVFGKVTPLKIGRTMHVWQIEIRDGQGNLSCVSRITIAVVPRRA